MGDSWIGGDIVGLQAMSAMMKPAPDRMRDVVHVLSSRTDRVVTDVGWTGSAADAFRKAWTTNSIQVGGLAEVVAAVGTIVGNLGDALAEVQANLYNAADAAAQLGAAIGPKGEPLPIITRGDPGDAAALQAREAQAEYIAVYQEAHYLAEGLRLKAGDELSGVFAKIDSNTGSSEPASPDKWVTVGDYVTGLYTVPTNENTAAARTLPASISDAEDTFRQARKDLDTAKASYEAKGLSLPAANDARLSHIEAHQNLVRLRESLDAARAGQGEAPGSRLLSTKLDDLAAKTPTGALYSAALPTELKFLKEIPVIDVLASGIAAEFQAHDDIEKGWSPEMARTANYSSAATGLAGGIGLGAGLAAGLGAAGVGAPAWVPIAAGGVGGIYVGEFANAAWHEHWLEDIYEGGPVGGIASGIGQSASTALEKTGETFSEVATSVWGVLVKR